MAKNDQVLIDGYLDDRVEQQVPSADRGEAFELFAFEQVLKDHDLSRDELESGWVDGEDDGGIDGFFIFVNGHLLEDPESFVWPKSSSELEVWLITAKHHNTFKQAPLDKLVASLSELLDFSLDSSELKGAYSAKVLRSRGHLSLAYRRLSPRLGTFRANLVYASRGDTGSIGAAVQARADQLQSVVRELFGTCETRADFVGASELIGLARRVPTYSLELPFLETLSRGERYVLLASLSGFNEFVTDESGGLRRYLFDSNVRDFMGLNRVNEDIQATLADPESSDFWWLNNGVTILTTAASVTGKVIQLEDVQIVNGLQTTESIYRFFSQGGTDPNGRAVLVKVIVSRDPVARDSIIRATNNQTNVEQASLRSTDKIQRDIEDILLRHGLYYERRTNHYANLGQPASSIVTPLYLASGFVSLVLKCPATGASLRTRFMRTEDRYRKVFAEEVPIEVWPRIAIALRKADNALSRARAGGGPRGERFLKRWRNLTALVALAEKLSGFGFSASDLAGLDTEDLSDDVMDSAWNRISHEVDALNKVQWRQKKFVKHICERIAFDLGVHDFVVVERNNAPWGHVDANHAGSVSSEFLDQVNMVLPAQPWKPGVHREVAQKLDCRVADVSRAIQILIDAGRRFNQVDGVVFDQDGGIVATDPDRQ